MYDLAIIGAGAAGIEAAKESLRHRLKSVLVDTDEDNFGGVCLNCGCIPTKYYLNRTLHNSSLNDIFQEKEKIVDAIKRPTLDYLARRGIDIIWGKASFLGEDKITVSGTKINASNIIVATGSLPTSVIEVDNKKVIYAQDFFSLKDIPSSFLIIGAGAVGLEIACILRNLNRNVIVAEKEDRILPFYERALSLRLQRILERKGIEFLLSASKLNTDDVDMVIVAAGRRPRVDFLGLKKAGIKQDARGWIEVDECLRTSAAHIYACGDVNGGLLFAYVAQRQAEIAVRSIAEGTLIKQDWRGLPRSVFTQPQLATVGILEEEARSRNIKFDVFKASFVRFSSSYVYSDTDGFIEVLVDRHGKILGAAIISRFAAELISIFSLAVRYNLSLYDLKDVTFIHPTIAEIIPSLLKQ